MQLKCTERPVPQNGILSYPLKLKNYDDLRDANVLVPRILVVLFVPDNLTDWVEHTEQQMLVRHCAYWVSLRNLPATPNTTSVNVQIPQGNTLNPASLRDIMARIGGGGLP